MTYFRKQGMHLQPSQTYLLIFFRVYPIAGNMEPMRFNGKTSKNSEREHELLAQTGFPGSMAPQLSLCSFCSDSYFSLCHLGRFFRPVQAALASSLSCFGSLRESVDP